MTISIPCRFESGILTTAGRTFFSKTKWSRWLGSVNYRVLDGRSSYWATPREKRHDSAAQR